MRLSSAFVTFGLFFFSSSDKNPGPNLPPGGGISIRFPSIVFSQSFKAVQYIISLNREESNILTILCSNKNQQPSDEGCPSFFKKWITVLRIALVGFLFVRSNTGDEIDAVPVPALCGVELFLLLLAHFVIGYELFHYSSPALSIGRGVAST